MAIVKCLQLPGLYNTADSTCKSFFRAYCKMSTADTAYIDATADLVIWTRYVFSPAFLQPLYKIIRLTSDSHLSVSSRTSS